MLAYVRNMQNPLSKQTNSFEHRIDEMEMRTVYQCAQLYSTMTDSFSVQYF